MCRSNTSDLLCGIPTRSLRQPGTKVHFHPRHYGHIIWALASTESRVSSAIGNLVNVNSDAIPDDVERFLVRLWEICDMEGPGRSGLGVFHATWLKMVINLAEVCEKVGARGVGQDVLDGWEREPHVAYRWVKDKMRGGDRVNISNKNTRNISDASSINARNNNNNNTSNTGNIRNTNINTGNTNNPNITIGSPPSPVNDYATAIIDLHPSQRQTIHSALQAGVQGKPIPDSAWRWLRRHDALCRYYRHANRLKQIMKEQGGLNDVEDKMAIEALNREGQQVDNEVERLLKVYRVNGERMEC